MRGRFDVSQSPYTAACRGFARKVERSLCDPNRAWALIPIFILAYVTLCKLLSSGASRAAPPSINTPQWVEPSIQDSPAGLRLQQSPTTDNCGRPGLRGGRVISHNVTTMVWCIGWGTWTVSFPWFRRESPYTATCRAVVSKLQGRLCDPDNALIVVASFLLLAYVLLKLLSSGTSRAPPGSCARHLPGVQEGGNSEVPHSQWVRSVGQGD
ncbi:hypothetical protein MTO96_009032 [Rhipicephalus appendiculatus]